MFRIALVSLAIFTFCIISTSLARELTPSIQFSAEEATQAKQAAQRLNDARTRNAKAESEWKSFRESYQAAHPELPDLRFTSDFQRAYVKLEVPLSVVPPLISTVTLNAEQQRQATASYQEQQQSAEALKRAEQQWRDFQYQLIAQHVSSSTHGGSLNLLPSNREYLFGDGWGSGIAFTPDFRFGVPAQR